ncbi:MAG: histidine phosphatase family protein [Bacteroidota bacterium]
MSEKNIYIIRHGQTDYNLRGIVQGGGVDTSLNDTGRQQAAAFHATYGHLPFETVITSKLKRTHETVAPFREKGLPWEQFAEINEMGWGDHEGKASTEVSRAEYQAVLKAWNEGDYSAAMPNGETAAELGNRLEAFVDHLRQRQEDWLLICSHGRAMRGLMCVLKELPLSQMSNFGHSNTGLWTMQQKGLRFVFDLENNTDHLLAKEGKQWKSLR